LRERLEVDECHKTFSESHFFSKFQVEEKVFEKFALKCLEVRGKFYFTVVLGLQTWCHNIQKNGTHLEDK
jgi:hypothetical protein